MNTQPIHVTVWGENIVEGRDEAVRSLYPEGMHAAIARFIGDRLGEHAQVRTATLQEPEHGLTEEVLASTDVLTWWGHAGHSQVEDEIVTRVQNRVLAGMGLIVLHSAHESRIFQRLMGTSCSLRWREANERELVWTVNPGHPITAGVPSPIVIPHQEMYGEYFDIPQPEELVFVSSFAGGEVFRGGCCFVRGMGRIFYFSPGHETHPVYHQTEIQQVIVNAVRWATPAAAHQSAAPTSQNSPMGWFEGGYEQ